MDTFFIWQLGLQFVLIMLNAIFACAEIAVLSLNEHKLAQLANQNDKRAIKLIDLKKQPAKFLATIQVAITLSGFLASAFAADNFSDSLVNFFINIGIKADLLVLDAISVVVITLILSYITLVFGELVPKRIAMKKSQALGLALASLLAFVAKIAAPIVWLLTKSTNAVLRILGVDPHVDDDDLSEEEILMMLEVGSQKGIIDHEENQIIKNLFNFDDLDISKVTTHRTQIDVLWLDDNVAQWELSMCQSKHSRYLICDKVIDNVVGVMRMRDYHCLADKSKNNILRTIVKQPFYVPEAVHADIVFTQMKLKKEQFAVVIDEYGGVVGVVTVTDLLSQLVGDIDDDVSLDIADDIKNIDKVWHIKGDAYLNDVVKKINVPLPVNEYTTFAGYVFGLYGAIPDEGASFTLETEHLRIYVEKVEKRTFVSARVEFLENNT